MLINIPEDVVYRLEKLAEAQGSSVADVLKTLLNRYAPESPPGSLAEMAQNARAADLASAYPVDTAERSRDILKTEYLQRRMKPDDFNG